MASVTVVAPVDGETAGGRSPFGSGDHLLTAAEVAEAMRISNMTVYRLIRTGQLAAVRVGKNYRIRQFELERYLAERTVRVEGMA